MSVLRLPGLLSCGIAGLSGASPAAAMAWPGPSRMSDEEKASQAPPAKGTPHGAVLLEEGESDDRTFLILRKQGESGE